MDNTYLARSFVVEEDRNTMLWSKMLDYSGYRLCHSWWCRVALCRDIIRRGDDIAAAQDKERIAAKLCSKQGPGMPSLTVL